MATSPLEVGSARSPSSDPIIKRLEQMRDRFLQTLDRAELKTLREECARHMVSLEGLFRGKIKVNLGQEIEDVLEQRIVLKEKENSSRRAAEAAVFIRSQAVSASNAELLAEFDILTEFLFRFRQKESYDSPAYLVSWAWVQKLMILAAQRVLAQKNARNMQRLLWALEVLNRSSSREHVRASVAPLRRILETSQPRPPAT